MSIDKFIGIIAALIIAQFIGIIVVGGLKDKGYIHKKIGSIATGLLSITAMISCLVTLSCRSVVRELSKSADIIEGKAYKVEELSEWTEFIAIDTDEGAKRKLIFNDLDIIVDNKVEAPVLYRNNRKYVGFVWIKHRDTLHINEETMEKLSVRAEKGLVD